MQTKRITKLSSSLNDNLYEFKYANNLLKHIYTTSRGSDYRGVYTFTYNDKDELINAQNFYFTEDNTKILESEFKLMSSDSKKIVVQDINYYSVPTGETSEVTFFLNRKGLIEKMTEVYRDEVLYVDVFEYDKNNNITTIVTEDYEKGYYVEKATFSYDNKKSFFKATGIPSWLWLLNIADGDLEYTSGTNNLISRYRNDRLVFEFSYTYGMDNYPISREINGTPGLIQYESID